MSPERKRVLVSSEKETENAANRHPRERISREERIPSWDCGQSAWEITEL